MDQSLIVLLSVGLFSFGLIIGSFLNVLVLRYGTGKTLSGRSGCLSCNSTLSPLELVPVFSYLFLRGRCRNCRSSISIQYPLVELSAGFLFLGVLWVVEFFPLNWFVLGETVSYFVLVSSLLALVVYDIRHQIIPDSFVIVFVLSAFFMHVFGGETVSSYFLSGLVLALPFVALWYFSRGKYMGLGDGKLAFGIGLLLGFSEGITAVILGFWSGAIFGLLLILFQKLGARLSLSGVTLTMKSEVPFAPFLVFGTLCVLYTHFSLFDQNLAVSLFKI